MVDDDAAESGVVDDGSADLVVVADELAVGDEAVLESVDPVDLWSM